MGGFGFGVAIGGFVGVGTLVWTVYSSCTVSPESFRNFAQEMLSFHVVCKTLEQHIHNQELRLGNNTLTSSAKDRDDMKILHDGLHAVMAELDARLLKCHSLTSKGIDSIWWDRLVIRWGHEDFIGFRERILMHISLLTAFNTSIMWYVHLPLGFL